MPFVNPLLAAMAERILNDAFQDVENWKADYGLTDRDSSEFRKALVNGDYINHEQYEEHLPPKEVPEATPREMKVKKISYKAERAKAARGGPADVRHCSNHH